MVSLPNAFVNRLLRLSSRSKSEGNILFVIGESHGHLGNSQYLSIIKNKEDGGTPSIILEEELKNGEFVLDCINQKIFQSVHDIGEGGLLVAIAEMCLAGNKGINIDIKKEFLHGYFFGEDQARYLVEVSKDELNNFENQAEAHEVQIEKIGVIEGSSLKIQSIGDINIKAFSRHHTDWFDKFSKN